MKLKILTTENSFPLGFIAHAASAALPSEMYQSAFLSLVAVNVRQKEVDLWTINKSNSSRMESLPEIDKTKNTNAEETERRKA